MERLIVNYGSREKRFAYLRNQKVEKIVIDRPEHRSLVGNIYYGTVTKVLPGMNAVFVDIGEEKQAYLHRDQLPSFVLGDDKQRNVSSCVHQGEKLLVQVDKDATGTKGAKVSGIIEIQGDNVIYMPNGRYVAVSKKIADEKQKASLRQFGSRLKTADEGLIFRTSSLRATEEELTQEFKLLQGRYQDLLHYAVQLKKPGLVLQKDTFIDMILEQAERLAPSGEVIVDDLGVKKLLEGKNIQTSFYNGRENIFSALKVEHEIEKALKRIVWLDQGAYLIFDETEALTIIDVNTGKFSGKSEYQDTVLKTNQLAAREIIRQLRLRDIGGIVLIDFINMNREQDKEKILTTLETEISRDDKRIKIIGFTPLGILQLTRKKTKVALSEALQEKCPVCEGTGRILSAESIAFRLERELLEHRNSEHDAVLIETTPSVREALLGTQNEHKETLENLVHLKFYFSIQHRDKPYYLLKQFGRESEIAEKAVDTLDD